MFFKRYKLINITDRTSAPKTFHKMIVSSWSDVDLGDATDDFVGVDTLTSLQYCYNAGPTDAVYSPLPPPTTGFDFFQGPRLKGVAGEDLNKNGRSDDQDTAIYNGKLWPGYVNLPVTAAYYFANGNDNIGDPPLGSDIDGSIQFYHFMEGRFGISGKLFTNLSTGLPTTFALSGDPVAGTGWLDGVELPKGDRRQGMASGPFEMAPGDTQEVVVAEIVAGATPGSDNIKAITTLRQYDKVAQAAYDAFFVLPAAPPAPKVKVTQLDQEILLDWGTDTAAVRATESDVNKNYKFQGYNIYQLPTASSPKPAPLGDITKEGVRIATYDVIDSLTTITDLEPDPTSGVIVSVAKQFGTNSGIKRYFDIKQDYIYKTPLVNGKKYYFAVTAYSYSSDPLDSPNNLENPLSIITCVPQSPAPGDRLSAGTQENITATHTGTADASVTVRTIDPSQLDGDSYEIFFNQSTYYQTIDGKLHLLKSKAVGKDGVEKPGDVSPSTMSFPITWLADSTMDVTGTMSLHAPGADFVDGVQVTLPAGIKIKSAEDVTDCYPGSRPGNTVAAVITGQTITWGDSSNSGFGCFDGSQVVKFNLEGKLPFDISYTIYDDGYDGNPVNAVGKVPAGAIIQNQWGVRDVTEGKNVLEHQTVLNGVDQYWPIGSTPTVGDLNNGSATVDTNATPIVDGFQVNVNGSFAAPLDINYMELNGKHLAIDAATGNYDITSFVIFGYPDGRASSSIGAYGGAGGTSDLDALQQDYELRWTGVRDTVVIGGKNVEITAPGTGQLATLFGASLYSIADDPANPNPGVKAPFLLRIPFEVWNIDSNQQVNLEVWHRLGNITDDPFKEWNTDSRMYAWVVNTPYDSTAPISPTSSTVADNATWNWVFFLSTYNTGDVIKVSYANPLQVGKDKFSFSTKAPTYSATTAKADVQSVNVFPNPYYGVNSQELNKYNRFVTFSHLPDNATIRIFNIAGVMVRTIVKSGGDQFQRWDLLNESGLPVASGLYIAYVDMGSLGTKILKFSIIQEQQILDRLN
jgi:hypothetical protein